QWLHLRAYAWGGHISFDDDSKYQGLTSQMPPNLVLGTSETNSVMVRYEKAWQNLFSFEHELQVALGQEKDSMPSGHLWIRTNPVKPPAPANTISTEDPEDDMLRSSLWDSIDKIEIDEYHNNAAADSDEQFTIEDNTITDEMRKLTKEYRWIAHSIVYHVKMTTPSLVLGNKPEDLQLLIKFYPFRRAFFHRAESALDNLLFGELKRLAK
ncbi:hypothetical protein QBC38DRAFT_349925, partial [Podospora fimiseda]